MRKVVGKSKGEMQWTGMKFLAYIACAACLAQNFMSFAGNSVIFDFMKDSRFTKNAVL